MSEALPQDIGSIFVLNGPEILVQPNGLSDPSHPPFHFVIPPAMLPPVCGLLAKELFGAGLRIKGLPMAAVAVGSLRLAGCLSRRHQV